MKKVAVVFYSGSGNTETMANAIAQGVQEGGAEATLIACGEFNADMISEYESFAFGCPATGAEELEEGEFAPMWESVKGSLGSAAVVLFGSYGWGGGEWMESWADSSSEVNIIAKCICEGTPDGDAEAECVEAGKQLA